MAKLDLKKDLKHLYRASAKQAVQVEVPPLQFLMIDGQGDPNTSREYQDAVEALFSVAYTAKFLIKRGELGVDYAVMSLEGLWWADDLSSFVNNQRQDWKWTMMILQPDFVDEALIGTAIAAAERKTRYRRAASYVSRELRKVLVSRPCTWGHSRRKALRFNGCTKPSTK